jgi:hypothetical protein
VGFCDFWVFFVVFGWPQRGLLMVICGNLRGDFVVGKTCHGFEINLWKFSGLMMRHPFSWPIQRRAVVLRTIPIHQNRCMGHLFLWLVREGIWLWVYSPFVRLQWRYGALWNQL